MLQGNAGCYMVPAVTLVEVANKSLRYFKLSVIKGKCEALTAVENLRQCDSCSKQGDNKGYDTLETFLGILIYKFNFSIDH